MLLSVLENYTNCYGNHNRKQLLSACNYFTFTNLFVTTSGLTPSFITNVLLKPEKNSYRCVLWWGGLAILPAGVFLLAKPPGHKQLFKKIMIFVNCLIILTWLF